MVQKVDPSMYNDSPAAPHLPTPAKSISAPLDKLPGLGDLTIVKTPETGAAHKE